MLTIATLWFEVDHGCPVTQRMSHRSANDRTLLQASKAYASETRWLSWWHLISALAILAGSIAATCLSGSWFIRLPFSLLAGLAVVRTFMVYHDFQHGAILRGSTLARCLLHGYGLLSLNPASIWSRSHNHHHRQVGRAFGASIGSYPVMTASAYAASSRRQRFAYALTRHPLTIACGYLTIFLYGMCVRSFLSDPRHHADSAFAVALHLTLLIGLASIDPALMLFALVLPMTVACGLGAYLFYAQHNYPAVKILARDQWSYCAAAMQTSSFIRMGRLARWFTGNIGYHHVHHVNALIPFYRLPEAMAGIPELQSPGTTSLRVRDVRRCLRLKVWNPQVGRMTGFRGAGEPLTVAAIDP